MSTAPLSGGSLEPTFPSAGAWAPFVAPEPQPARRRRGGALSLLEQVGNAPRVFGGEPYVAASVGACLGDRWTLRTVDMATGEEFLSPFRCKSWRCPRCAPSVNARDAQRAQEALGRVDPRHVLFVTLTFDHEPWLCLARTVVDDELQVEALARDLAWRDTRACWKRLRDRLVYRIGRGFGRSKKKARIDYLQTWEGHRSGWPHVHAVLVSEDLAADVKANGSYQRVNEHTGEPQAIWRWGKQVLSRLAKLAGFGTVCDVQFPRSWEAVAGYLVKLAKELTQSVHKGQAPICAPKRFRRIRSTPRFLPPIRVKHENWCGELLQAPLEMLAREIEHGADTWKTAEGRVKTLLERSPTRGREPPNARESLAGT